MIARVARRNALGSQAQRLGAGHTGATSAGGGGRPVALLLGTYAALGAAGAAGCIALGRSPLSCLACDGWLGDGGPAAALVSVGLGLGVGVATVAATRAMVGRVAWARALHQALRPAVVGAGDRWLLGVAAVSAVGEELLFRGLLVPLVGVLASSLLFGALHQVRGPARWGWMAWATGMGLVFAGLFAATGSLAGPIVAHFAINAANLRFLRDHDLAPRARVLGGLLHRG